MIHGLLAWAFRLLHGRVENDDDDLETWACVSMETFAEDWDSEADAIYDDLPEDVLSGNSER